MKLEKHNPKNAIAIVGAAGVFPGSASARQLFENIVRSRCFVRDIPKWLWEQEVFYDDDRDAPVASYSRLAALLQDLDLDVGQFRIPPNVAAYMSRNQKLALICTHQALCDAGYLPEYFDHERTGVVLGAVVGDSVKQFAETILSRRFHSQLEKLANTEQQRKALAELWESYESANDVPITEDSLSGTGASLVAGRIASAFDLHGPNLAVDSACASTPAAIASAVEMLRSGVCDMMITGGVETDSDVGFFVGFSKIGALSATGSFPFDQQANGFVMGEGCGIFVLKRYEDALRDNDQIYALIRGWGSSSDGAGKGITAPSSGGQLRALRRAYEDAALSPALLDYVECHGTGTQVGDATELEALGQFVQETREQPLPVGSVKAMVGHLKTASGAAGLFRGLLVINSGVVPPQVNFESPSKAVDWEALKLRVPSTPEVITTKEVVVGVSSFGFGGTNYHLVVSTSPMQGRKPLINREAILRSDLPALNNDIAFLFPGQGSQYVGMLQGLREDSVAQEYLRIADQITREITGKSIIEAIYPDNHQGSHDNQAQELALKATNVAQPAIFAVSAILLEHVRRAGIDCSMAIGHSLGELTALYAAGYFSFEDAVRIIAHRGQTAVERTSDEAGYMAIVNAGEVSVREMLKDIDGYIICANINSYDQTVVSGDAKAVDDLIELATLQGLLAKPVNADRAFHSHYMEPTVKPFRDVLEKTRIGAAGIPVTGYRRGEIYPFTTGQHTDVLNDADRSHFIDMLTQQNVSPVDFVSQIELAYQSGIRRFVEIGPRSVLSGLVNDILQGKKFQAIYLDRRARVMKQLKELPDLLRQPLGFHRKPLPVKDRFTTGLQKHKEVITSADVGVEDWVRQVVSDVSGYPLNKLDDYAEFERDLGIDTLKIFDIISRLRGNVLPQDFRRYQEAGSIHKILDISASVNPDGQNNSEVGQDAGAVLYCYRHDKVSMPLADYANPNPNPNPAVTEGKYRLIVSEGSQLAAEICDQLEDDKAMDSLLLWPLPMLAEQLVKMTVPDILQAVVGLAEQNGNTQGTSRVHVVSYCSPEDYNKAFFYALSALIKSFQLDLPAFTFSYCHISSPAPDYETLRASLQCQLIGEHMKPDAVIELPRLVPEVSVLRKQKNELSTLLGDDDRVLVTGGARGIASSVVRHLLDNTRARFLLIGRKAHAESWIDDYDSHRIDYLQANLTDREAVANLRLSQQPITLLIHAAGIVKSRPLNKANAEEIETVMGTKVLGLHYLLDTMNLSRLRAIVNFSSTAGFIGAPGNMDYAAANGYLNGLQVEAVPVLSIGWSAWDEVGMASNRITREFMKSSGIELIPVKSGVDIFSGLLAMFLEQSLPESASYLVHAGMAESCFLPNDPYREDMVDKPTMIADKDDSGFQITELNDSLL